MDIQTVLKHLSNMITTLEETTFKNRIEIAHQDYQIEQHELTIDKLQLESASNYSTIQRLREQNKKLFRELKSLNQITNMEAGYPNKEAILKLDI